MDERVLEVQRWVNMRYAENPRHPNFGASVTENGRTSWETMHALTRALQLELGIANPVNSFGPTTYRLCPTLREGDQGNIVFILQGAMWCKGYSPGGFTGTFGPGTANGVRNMQQEAGVIINGIVNPDIFKAMLNMDAYRAVNSSSDSNIVDMQRYLNGKYHNYTGILPADGHYSRDTNTALIYGLQVESNVSGANGNFGPGTRAATPTIRRGDNRRNFVILFQFSMYLNNYNPGNFIGNFNELMENRLKSFQSFHMLPENGVGDLNSWMALLISTGNPDIKGKGADTSYTITNARAETLKADGREVIGRYLTGSFALSSAELNTLYRHDLRVFPIYQRFADNAEWFSYNQGIIDAQDAVRAAATLRFPYDTIIYFAVDYDVSLSQTDNLIIPYFQGVNEEILRSKNKGASYRVGVYAPRYVCSSLSRQSLVVSSFVSGMSTGFFGNKGHNLPFNWAFNQVREHYIGQGQGTLPIDNLIVSQRDRGVLGKDFTVRPPEIDNYEETNKPFFDKLKVLYDFAYENSGDSYFIANILTLNYLRSENYGAPIWIPIAGGIDSSFVEAAVEKFGKPSDFPTLFDPVTGTDMDFMHMAASLNAIIFQETFKYGDFISSLSDFAGWLGDLITVVDDALNGVNSGRFDSVYEAAYYYIGHSSDSAGTFPLEDLLGDMDALNLGRALDLNSENANLYEEMQTYYNLGYRRRFKAAAHARFNYDRQEFYNEAKRYLTTSWINISVPRNLFKSAFNVQDWTESDAESVARAFRDVCSEWLDKED